MTSKWVREYLPSLPVHNVSEEARERAAFVAAEREYRLRAENARLRLTDEELLAVRMAQFDYAQASDERSAHISAAIGNLATRHRGTDNHRAELLNEFATQRGGLLVPFDPPMLLLTTDERWAIEAAIAEVDYEGKPPSLSRMASILRGLLERTQEKNDE